MTTSTTPDRFAVDLSRAVLAGRHGPCLAGFPAGGGPPLVVPLGGNHPLELLWELRAPGRWEAIVVVATGRVVAAGPDGPGGGPPADPGASRGAPVGEVVVVAAVTGRSGPDRSLVLDGEGRLVLARSEVTGLVPDACRRVLGRDTAPPEAPVTAWWATDWLLDVVLHVGAAGTDPWTLHDLVALHPAVELEELPASTAELVGFVIERGWDHAHLTGWEGVRRSLAEGHLVDPSCPARLARWYDTGSFSRYAQASRPTPAALLARVRPALAAGVAATIERVLARWQLGPVP